MIQVGGAQPNPQLPASDESEQEIAITLDSRLEAIS